MKAPMIVLTGGGTGGHIVPILAVASELKKLCPDATIVYIGEKGGVLLDIPAKHPAIDAVYTVRAGKFRRFYGEGWRQLFDIKTQASNIRDAYWVLIGIWQSYWLLRKLRPNVIFTRGGYVSVPVALGGVLRRVPFITHDSDSTPGLANRIISRWAAAHAVGLEPELYPYPIAKTVMVGVPVSGEYQAVTTKLQQSYRHEIDVPVAARMLFVTGGGNGADSLNRLIVQNMPRLIDRYPDLMLVQTAGRSLEASLNALYDELLPSDERSHVRVEGFLDGMYRYTGAADVVLCRAGASTLAELAIQGKACIVVPASQLVWQEHQARTLAAHDAIINLHQSNAAKGDTLFDIVCDLFDHPEKRATLGENLQKLAVPNAAQRLAELLLDKMHA